MDLGLKGKNAIITGASQGIGQAIAFSLAAEGCNVAIGARDQGRIDATVAEIESKGVKGVGIICDLSSEAGCQKFVEDARATMGGIQILVNNVGGSGVPQYVVETSDETGTGVDFQVDWAPLAGFEAYLNLQYIDVTFDERITRSGVDLSGQPTGT
ncbi:MAG: hypothetical protein CMM45_06030, partial [Rhodospirillaceae bacterium]|nr:hypothetical protein [Rhodospirillaceae bacterium]